MKYVTISDEAKLELLREHSLEGEWPNLDYKLWCLHCGLQFDGHSVRVWQDSQGDLWLECGTPGCDGSPIDWATEPWWDEKFSPPESTAQDSRDNDPAQSHSE